MTKVGALDSFSLWQCFLIKVPGVLHHDLDDFRRGLQQPKPLYGSCHYGVSFWSECVFPLCTVMAHICIWQAWCHSDADQLQCGIVVCTPHNKNIFGEFKLISLFVSSPISDMNDVFLGCRRSKKYVRAEILIATNIMRPNRLDPTKTDFVSVTHINPGGIIDSRIGSKIANALCAKAPVKLLKSLERAANSPPSPTISLRSMYENNECALALVV